jgi:DNA polymerase (family 10)
MTNKAIAAVLEETADLIELTDGNPHRARAFSRAARALNDLDDAVSDRLSDGTLQDVGGIGDAMVDHVADIVDTGTFPLHDELLNAIPPGLLDVMKVKGLGTKRTRRLWQELEITSLDELEDAATTDQITSLSGFGAKTQSNILDNLRQLRAYEDKWRLADAWSAAAPLLAELRGLDSVKRAELTGALRRHREIVEHIDVIVSTDASDAVADGLADYVEAAPTRDDDVLSVSLPDGIPLRLHCTPPDTFGTDWWRTTGTAAHVDAWTDRFGAPDAHATEEALFSAADCPVIPPELREADGELDAAAENTLPDLVTVDDLQGCLHNHSTYSDGGDSLTAMAEAAQALGFSYFGICDHSQSLQIASGLSPNDVRRQHDEVQALNDTMADDFRIFHGIESDILKDGSLDYDDEVLALFDFIVASVHTGFSMTEAEATDRVVTAVQNPHTRILGHPTGRLLLSREGYPLDHERVIEACAAHDVALELNANPYRLDLDWRWVRRATDAGVLISINPDAHATNELEYVQWGVRVGRKGWLTPDQCLNAKSLSDFAAWVARGPAAA